MITIISDIHLGLPGNFELPDGDGALVVLGDIVDRNVGTEWTRKGEKLLAESSFETIHFIPGNHDVHNNFKWPEGIIVHGTEPHFFEIDGVQAWTCGVATDPDPREIEIPSFNGLGLLHTSVHGEFSRKPCLPCKLEDLQESGATWVLGHVHKPITLSAEPFIGWTGMRAGVHYDPTTSAVSRFS
ncbi:MAG: metallophosphoesterase [Corynebacterium striatum]|nr:metallophosphoesterase [Corynebacterium striatum]